MSKSSTDDEEKQKATIQVKTAQEEEEETRRLKVYFNNKSTPDLDLDGKDGTIWHTLKDADGKSRLEVQYSYDKASGTGTINFDTKRHKYRGEIEITDEAGKPLACFKCKDNGDITLNGVTVISGDKVVNSELLRTCLKNVEDVIQINGVEICNPEIEKGVAKARAAVSTANKDPAPAADPSAVSPPTKGPTFSI